MKPVRRLVLAALVAALATGAFAGEGNVNLFVGQKWLDEEDWEPIEAQPELGVQLAFGPRRAPIYFALDLFYAKDDATIADVPGLGDADVEGKTIEYCLGVRKVFRRQAVMRPHLGAGALLASGEIVVEAAPVGSSRVSDTNFGLWIEGGITWRLASHLNLGLELRYSRYKLEFGTIFLENELESGGYHAGALIGYAW